MTRRLTVWTPVTAESATSAIALLRHLDGQTLAASEWELVLAAGAGTDVSALEVAASHRPNVRVLVGDADRTRATGDWVLDLAPEDRLEATALSRLVDLTSQAGGEDVLTVRADAARRHTADDVVVLTRRGAAADGGARSAETVVPTSVRCEPGPALLEEQATLLPGVTAEVRWVDGELELHGRATLPAPGALRAHVVLVGKDSGSVRARPVDAFTVSGDDEDSEPSLLWTARVPVTPEDPDDELELWLEVAASETDDEENEAPRPEPVPPLVGRVESPPEVVTDAPAVLDGRLVSVRSDGDGLVVDVGAIGRSVLGHLDPTQATVVEDATGSLLRVTLPQLAHRGTGVVDGALVLNGVRLPARLIVDDEPRVECYLVGQPGRSSLGASFGPGPDAPTGCEVLTSATGEYTVVTPVSRARVAAPAKRSSAARPRPQATGPVAALRRRLPRGVEPAVSKLARLPALREAYRRATGLR